QNVTQETTAPTTTIPHDFGTAGTYNVALTVMTGDGTSNGTAHNITVASPPTASFTVQPASPANGTIVSFNGTGSSDPNPGGSIASFRVIFGDGGSSSAHNPIHTYSHAGTYTVTLVVTDSAGHVSTASGQLTIRPPRCVVVDVRGYSLKKARSAIKLFR